MGDDKVALAAPMEYDGDKRKARLFLQQVKMYMTIKAKHFPDDLTKVAFALSYMKKGEAARFAETYYRLDHSKSGGPMGTYDKFVEAFEAQFVAKEVRRAAIDRLVTLKQTGSVDAYIGIFRRLLADSELDSVVAEEFFRRGLKREVAMDIMRHDKLPENLVDWMDTALDVEARRNSVYGKETYQKKKDPWAMDIDKVEAEGEGATAESSARQLSAGEKDRRRRLGLCFKCGLKGLSRDCPNHPKAQAWKPGNKPSTSARAATVAPPVAGPSAKKIEVDESVLNRLLAMEEKFNKLTEKDF